ncbi:MAG: gliding motility-associated C-terminal domain-containing protein [Chitinophagaceae bacterium]|nr:gliding motility-associated C-terminal domain-containing protein [Chitinophagaceae bacterium]
MLGILFLADHSSLAQCATPINSFPYTEGFEANDGGWTTGGTASDWTWGTPAKPVITGASAGTKCWVTGGLTGSSYNNSENSWLQSPCFDFTLLAYPRISFSVFYETERRFDGASLEYSINNGTTWNLIGSTNESACTASNWYNQSPVVFLGNTSGWSGNIQPNAGPCLGGSGSGAWLNAWHDVSFLAGIPNVLFRFRFAAGSTCNNYDGFAIDEVVIGEAPPNTGDFTFSCTGNRNVAFTSTPSLCFTSFDWNFDDIASGASNTSTLQNPSHLFSAAGTYNVSLTISFETGATVFITHPIEILDVNINELIPVFCNGGNTGAIVAIVNGGVGTYNYSWNTVPPQTTFDLNNIGAGTYTVLVSSATACPTSATYVLSEPTAVNLSTAITDEACNLKNGSISASVSGGTTPYFYTWSNGGTGSSITILSAGNYSLAGQDGNGCPFTALNLVVNNIQVPVSVSLGNDTTTCTFKGFDLKPGTYQSYLWQDNSINPTFKVTSSGTYWVTVTNSQGCTGSDTVKVTIDCSDVYFPGAFTPNGDGKNDGFGPIGTAVSKIRNFVLRVYDRYGEPVYYSTDPYKKWDGTLKGSKFNSGTFTWFATYNLDGKGGDQQSGTVILLR